jgi:leader peptidase (prepilin peptidase)/N-methyltransferase
MPDPFTLIILLFLFLLGACVGSFLNVIAIRLPNADVPDTAGPFGVLRAQMRSISYPPSTCPQCGSKLKLYDNVPILGWLWLRGRCRNCGNPISFRYPLVEIVTAFLFVGLFVPMFLAGPNWGPVTPAVDRFDPAVREARLEWARFERVEISEVEERSAQAASVPVPRLVRMEADLSRHWPMLVIVLVLATCLLTASLIDAELYIIPRTLSYLPAVVAVPMHAIFGGPVEPMSTWVGPVGCAWAIGGGIGWLLALGLTSFGLLPRSFASGLPPTERDDEEPESPGVVRREMLWEVAFVALPIGLGFVAAWLAVTGRVEWFEQIASHRWLACGLGSLFGGLVAAGVIWITRILGSLFFGREAMGLGDVDLMFGVGCCIGAVPAGLVMFPAALAGLGFAVIRLLTRGGREMPFGPYLAIGSIVMLLFFNHVADYARPAMAGLSFLLGDWSSIIGL